MSLYLKRTIQNLLQHSPFGIALSGLVVTVLLLSTLPTTFDAVAQRSRPQPAYLASAGNVNARNEAIQFAIIGDYGIENHRTYAVAALVKSWNPDFVTTVGDNNYPNGEADHIDHHVGQYYHQFLHPYEGNYGSGAAVQRFFPVLGNHDWGSISCVGSECSGPYFDYFNLSGSDERYYTFEKGPVRFFMLNSVVNEPDGISGISNQAMWLKDQLAASEATWNFVFLHHPPHSSGGDHSYKLLQWPFAQWGADAVFSGHSHLYERIYNDGMLFFVNGLGGKSKHYFQEKMPSWVKFRYNYNFGAMRVTATHNAATFGFVDMFGRLQDSHTLTASGEESSSLKSASPRHVVSVSVAHSAEDAVEVLPLGTVETAGYVLNLGGNDAGAKTLVGLRFDQLEIPRNATILSAQIELATQRDENVNSNLFIAGEKSCSARSFNLQPYGLSSRPKTTSQLLWEDLDDWKLVGESHFTPDLSPIVQEIVNEAGWQPGHAMAFFLWGGGQRYAVAYELQPQVAAKLHIAFEAAADDEHSEESEYTVHPFPHDLYLPMLFNELCSKG